MAKTNFEEKLRNLETIVSRMDGGKLTLDEMIAAFEEGQKLVASCQEELQAIKLKIDKVTASRGREPVEVLGNGDIKL
ncbi:MAG: exodeoxyribonuclease VII small subunit [Kiritimatiellae bacterium]|nr:exodeoxyribonuclease VII small subunit [Kiritimatiellia bacterium]